jgi:hypothetical protein
VAGFFSNESIRRCQLLQPLRGFAAGPKLQHAINRQQRQLTNHGQHFDLVHDAHLRLLARRRSLIKLARKIVHEEFRQMLRDADSPKVIADIIKKEVTL